jgi:hypothetical protein
MEDAEWDDDWPVGSDYRWLSLSLPRPLKNYIAIDVFDVY